MKADLPQREPEIQRFWEERGIYRRVQERARLAGRPKFILHDGPPYANGHIHIGHALNKILKDIVIKYRSLQGYYAPLVHGWDTHGLPIEQRVIKDLGLNRAEISPVEFRRRCRDYALKYAAIQRDEIKRLGVWGNWEESYLTLAPEYEACQIEVFGEMAQKGYIYRGLKSVYWCVVCETALAEAEIEYADRVSPSIYVRFPVREDGGRLGVDLARTFFLIWTTTPWTIPANQAVAVHPDFTYAVVEVEGDFLVVAHDLLPEVAKALGWRNPRVRSTLTGRELEGVCCRHPLFDRDSPVVLGEHVTLDQGTGCVHTAPGHGEEDFLLGELYGLEVLCPVTADGHFTTEAGKYAGLTLSEGNEAVMKDLAVGGYLAAREEVTHSYPHCWRCKNPVIFRATEQWFASVEGFRQKALEAIHQVRWYPSWGEERIKNMVAERRDWCISRQRVWGVPIPIFYCEGCGRSILDERTISAVRDLFAREGSDAWFVRSAEEILPPGYRCPECGGGAFRKETDIMDVWFDSGSSHAAVLAARAELGWPADLYLEGSDQHRGWFQSSLLTGVATRGAAPYRAVLTHGFIVDEEGRKMSKSLGNVVAPEEVIRQYGADILRLWVTSSDYTDDIGVSPGILRQMAEVYRRIRNTCRFLLGNLYDFDPRRDLVPYGDLPELDRWALLRLARLVQRLTEAFDAYQFYHFYHSVHNFCTVDLSAFYLDVIKDRLYTSRANAPQRRAAQTVLFHILSTLVRLLAPILSHTAEEIWQHLPAHLAEGPRPESVYLTEWPKVEASYLDLGLEERWERLLRVRGVVSKALELARGQKLIGNSLEAAVTLYPDQEVYEWLLPFEAELATIFIVSQAALAEPGSTPLPQSYRAPDLPGLAVAVTRAAGSKCARCWVWRPEVGQDAEFPDLCPRCLAVLRG